MVFRDSSWAKKDFGLKRIQNFKNDLQPDLSENGSAQSASLSTSTSSSAAPLYFYNLKTSHKIIFTVLG